MVTLSADAYERHKADARARSAAKAAAGRELAEIPDVVDPELRVRCEDDLRTFLEECFPAAFRLGWSDDHLTLIAELQKVILTGGFRAVCMPRGTGKTTIIRRAMIWAI